MSQTLRLGFAGTPDFARTQLAALIDHAFDVAVVFTQPDRPRGRGRKTQPSPVKALALDHRLPVREPKSLKRETLGEPLDLLVVAAYGLLLPPHILEEPRLGCLNVHASLLPRWRGAAPVERAIMAGDQETGVCLMQMDEGLDTGPVYASTRTPIGPTESGGQLEARLAELGAELLVATLPHLESMTPTPQPDAGATYARKLDRSDTVVQWTASADQIADQIRALSDRNPATVLGAGADIRIRLLEAHGLPTDPETATPGTICAADKQGIRVACGSGTLIITRVQLNRGKGTPMAAAAAINGYPDIFEIGASFLGADDTEADTPEAAGATSREPRDIG